MTKNRIFGFFSIFLIYWSYGNASIIQSGQPGQTINSGVLEKDFMQIQSNVQFEELNDIDKLSLFSNTLRFGFSEKIEFSTVFDQFYNDYFESSNGSSWQIGFRYANSFLKYELPYAVQVRVAEDSEGRFGAILLSATTIKINKNVSWVTNLGYKRFENADGLFNYASSMNHQVTSQFSFFYEIYGENRSKNQFKVDAGLAYLLNKNIQIDASAGLNLNEVENTFVNIGLSYRFLK